MLKVGDIVTYINDEYEVIKVSGSDVILEDNKGYRIVVDVKEIDK